MGLKLLGEKSKTFLRLAEEEEEEEGAGKNVVRMFKFAPAAPLPAPASELSPFPGKAGVGEPARLSQGVEEGCGHRSQDGVKGRPQGQVTVVEHQANPNTSRDCV